MALRIPGVSAGQDLVVREYGHTGKAIVAWAAHVGLDDTEARVRRPGGIEPRDSPIPVPAEVAVPGHNDLAVRLPGDALDVRLRAHGDRAFAGGPKGIVNAAIIIEALNHEAERPA